MSKKKKIATMEDYVLELGKLEESRIRPGTIKAFLQKVEDWFSTNGNGREVTPEAIEKARLAAKNLRGVAKHRSTHPDPTIRHNANALIRSMQHRDDLGALSRRLSKFTGLVNKSGRRANQKAAMANARTHQLRDDYKLTHACTLEMLMAAGRALGNCLSKKKFAKSYLNTQDTEYWTLDHPIFGMQAVFQVDTSDERMIEHCEGRNKKVPKLPPELASEILTALEANGDDEAAFRSIGIFQAFANGVPEVKAVEVEGCQYRIWNFADRAEIIISCQYPGGRTRWGKFRCRAGSIASSSWDFCERRKTLNDDNLLYLLVNYPELMQHFRTPVQLPG